MFSLKMAPCHLSLHSEKLNKKPEMETTLEKHTEQEMETTIRLSTAEAKDTNDKLR